MNSFIWRFSRRAFVELNALREGEPLKVHVNNILSLSARRKLETLLFPILFSSYVNGFENKSKRN